MESLFTPLIEEGITTLKIRYDKKADLHYVYLAKQWEDDLRFSNYNKQFFLGSSLTSNDLHFGNKETRDIYAKYGLGSYLEKVFDLLRAGGHFGIDCYYHRGKDIRFMGNIHNVQMGINNRSHAVVSGGIRRHPLHEKELEVIVDGLNLARAMTFKNIAAEIPYGGCKSTVQMGEFNLNDNEVMGFLAFCIDSIRCFTGPDMRFPTEMSDEMNKSYSVQFTGGPKGPLGPTGGPTADGCYWALKEAARFYYGSDSLEGLTIAVQGLGSVGWPMCEHFLNEGAKLLVTDIDKGLADKLRKQWPDKEISYVEPADILKVRADILCPCALGGILDDNSINDLKVDIVFGPANNQLKATSREEEERLAQLLADRGILYQCDWWHNTGGVLAGAEEYERGVQASVSRLAERIRATVPRITWENLNQAKDRGVTPTQNAYDYCLKKLGE